MHMLYSTMVVEEQGSYMIEHDCDVKSHVSVAAVERHTVTYEEQGTQSRHLSVVMRPLENQAFEKFCISSSREIFCNYYSRTSN